MSGPDFLLLVEFKIAVTGIHYDPDCMHVIFRIQVETDVGPIGIIACAFM